MVIEPSGMWFRLKSFVWSQNRVWFVIKSMISDQNYMTRGSITTLLHPFWNHPNTGLGQFKYSIDAGLSWFEIKFIHFWGRKKKKSFGNKSCKIYNMILFIFHFPEIWLVTLNKLWNLISCFVFSVASLAGKKCDLKQKMVWQTVPIRANHITGTTTDFKMGVINK